MVPSAAVAAVEEVQAPSRASLGPSHGRFREIPRPGEIPMLERGRQRFGDGASSIPGEADDCCGDMRWRRQKEVTFTEEEKQNLSPQLVVNKQK